MMRVRHRESGRVLADRCWVAESFWARLRGWLAHTPLTGEGLWVRRCRWIHTAGVRVPLDVIFCDDDGTVDRIVAGLGPGRIAGAAGSTAVCELPAGGAAGVVHGDHLDLLPACAPADPRR